MRLGWIRTRALGFEDACFSVATVKAKNLAVLHGDDILRGNDNKTPRQRDYSVWPLCIATTTERRGREITVSGRSAWRRRQDTGAEEDQTPVYLEKYICFDREQRD